MGIPGFRRIRSTNSDITRLQDAVAEPIRQITSKSILDGVVVSDVSLASGNTTFNHKLGRKPIGYLVIKRSGAADIYDSDLTITSITVNSSAAITASFWVF